MPLQIGCLHYFHMSNPSQDLCTSKVCSSFCVKIATCIARKHCRLTPPPPATIAVATAPLLLVPFPFFCLAGWHTVWSSWTTQTTQA